MGLVTTGIDDALACPFCITQERALETRGYPHGQYWVVCRRCESTGPEGDSPVMAVERWNRRRNDPAPEPMTTDEVRKILADNRLEDDDGR